MIATLEEMLKVKFPKPETLSSPETNKFLDDICKKHQVRSVKIFYIDSILTLLHSLGRMSFAED